MLPSSFVLGRWPGIELVFICVAFLLRSQFLGIICAAKKIADVEESYLIQWSPYGIVKKVESSPESHSECGY